MATDFTLPMPMSDLITALVTVLVFLPAVVITARLVKAALRQPAQAKSVKLH